MVKELHRFGKCGWRQFGVAESVKAATRLSTRSVRGVEARLLQMMKMSKVDVDVRMSDRMTKKAEVWAPDQGGKIHSHV
jgi:hypothetical protein